MSDLPSAKRSRKPGLPVALRFAALPSDLHRHVISWLSASDYRVPAVLYASFALSLRGVADRRADPDAPPCEPLREAAIDAAYSMLEGCEQLRWHMRMNAGDVGNWTAVERGFMIPEYAEALLRKAVGLASQVALGKRCALCLGCISESGPPSGKLPRSMGASERRLWLCFHREAVAHDPCWTAYFRKKVAATGTECLSLHGIERPGSLWIIERSVDPQPVHRQRAIDSIRFYAAATRLLECGCDGGALALSGRMVQRLGELFEAVERDGWKWSELASAVGRLCSRDAPFMGRLASAALEVRFSAVAAPDEEKSYSANEAIANLAVAELFEADDLRPAPSAIELLRRAGARLSAEASRKSLAQNA